MTRPASVAHVAILAGVVRPYLLGAFIVMIPHVADGQTLASLRPQVYLGVQHVAPWRVTVQQFNPAVTALALWPLPKRTSVQLQWIQPVRRDDPVLIRFAMDVRVF